MKHILGEHPAAITEPFAEDRDIRPSYAAHAEVDQHAPPIHWIPGHRSTTCNNPLPIRVAVLFAVP
ncbi:hypothetical protein TNCT_527951, partial [Trichonephila clavata]